MRRGMGTAGKDKDRFPAARNLKAVHKTKLYQEITEQIERQSKEASRNTATSSRRSVG